MEIGISTATFFGKLPVEDSFAEIKACGAKLAEVFLTTYSEYLPQFGDLLKEQAKGVRVHSVHTLNSQFEPQLFHGVERTRRDAECIFRMALETGKKLGAKYYTFHGPGRMKKKDNAFDYAKLGGQMRRLYEIADEYGVTVSLENVHWAYYNFVGFYSELKKHCPGLRGTLDVKQAFQAGVDYRLFLREMGRDISTVHVCDYLPDGRLRPIGKGSFDFKELMHLLREEGIDAPVLIELYSGDYSDFSEVKEGVQYLRSL